MNICKYKKIWLTFSAIDSLIKKPKVKKEEFPFSVLLIEVIQYIDAISYIHSTAYTSLSAWYADFSFLFIYRTAQHLIICSLNITSGKFISESGKDLCVYFCIFMCIKHTDAHAQRF